MKNILFTLILLFTFSSFSQSSRSYKVLQKLRFNQLTDFDISQPITFNNDVGWQFLSDFKMIFDYYDFDIISDVDSKKISSLKKEYTSLYEITIQGNSRLDIGVCNGEVPSTIYVKIIDLMNDDSTVATFNFSQGVLEGKCTRNVAEAIIIKLKEF